MKLYIEAAASDMQRETTRATLAGDACAAEGPGFTQPPGSMRNARKTWGRPLPLLQLLASVSRTLASHKLSS